MHRKIFAALPVMNESEWLGRTLESIAYQEDVELTLVACVNQPEDYHYYPDKASIVEDNRKCLILLHSYKNQGLRIHILDHTSKGKGWTGKHRGVGIARKTAMDFCAAIAQPHDVIASIDADTFYPPDYFRNIVFAFDELPAISSISVPYHHPLSGEEETDRLMLRYEIYMRVYALNMLRIGNPYAFAALGSAMATSVNVYRKVKGLAPHTAGEDFYFLQKLCKHGPLLTYVPTKAFPAGRLSDRVIFGTGPALIKGRIGDWSSYPIYHYTLFNVVKETYDCFDKLYKGDFATPMDDFLKNIGKEVDIWDSLRRNTRSPKTFLKACMQKVDGLRILQYLKSNQPFLQKTDDECLTDFMKYYFGIDLNESFSSFQMSDVRTLDNIRLLLEKEEYTLREKNPIVNIKYFDEG